MAHHPNQRGERLTPAGCFSELQHSFEKGNGNAEGSGCQDALTGIVWINQIGLTTPSRRQEAGNDLFRTGGITRNREDWDDLTWCDTFRFRILYWPSENQARGWLDGELEKARFKIRLEIDYAAFPHLTICMAAVRSIHKHDLIGIPGAGEKGDGIPKVRPRRYPEWQAPPRS